MKRKVSQFLKTAVCGFFMALADSVPRVSGGTVAFFAGEHESFFGSFGNLIGRDKSLCRQSLGILLRLEIGWLLGMGLSAALLSGVLHTHIYAVSSLFFGLVAAPIPLVAVEEKGALKACRPLHFLLFVAGVGAVVALSLLHVSVSTENWSFLSALCVFLGGALTISAMVLPAVSGSTLLLALGLIAGLLFTVIMGPTTLAEPLPPLSLRHANPWLFLFGILFVAGFAAAKILTEKRRNRHGGMDHTT